MTTPTPPPAGSKPNPKHATDFFIGPVLFAANLLSGGTITKTMKVSEIEDQICKGMNIDIHKMGTQPATNQPFVRVYINGAINKLASKQHLVRVDKENVKLTDEGLKEVAVVIEQYKNTPPEDIMENVKTDDAEKLAAKQASALKAEEERKEAEAKAEKEEAVRKERLAKGAATMFGGISCDVHSGVPERACLPMPEHYRVATIGRAAKQIKEIAIALKSKRSVYIHGLPGSGKDASIHAFSALTRTPARMFTVSPNEDIQSWFFSRSFSNGGTGWEEGEFLKAARDGYQTEDGRVLPYILLISDLDRATKSQAEVIRLVMDSISGRIMGPGGVVYDVLPGTQIVATANSSGGGDSRGRCVSSNLIDASILNRFQRKFQVDVMDWDDEKVVLQAKFPVFGKKMASSWDAVGNCVKIFRKNVEDEKIYAEFGHRDICNWIGHAEDILTTEYVNKATIDDEKLRADILRRSGYVLLDSMPDPQTRMAVGKLMDPYIKNGMIEKDR